KPRRAADSINKEDFQSPFHLQIITMWTFMRMQAGSACHNVLWKIQNLRDRVVRGLFAYSRTLFFLENLVDFLDHYINLIHTGRERSRQARVCIRGTEIQGNKTQNSPTGEAQNFLSISSGPN
ncbi:hypothetical protein ACJX0J_018342, partial [Zea mays]